MDIDSKLTDLELRGRQLEVSIRAGELHAISADKLLAPRLLSLALSLLETNVVFRLQTIL